MSEVISRHIGTTYPHADMAMNVADVRAQTIHVLLIDYQLRCLCARQRILEQQYISLDPHVHKV